MEYWSLTNISKKGRNEGGKTRVFGKHSVVFSCREMVMEILKVIERREN